MRKARLIGFNAAKLAEQMMANAVAEQNRRLIDYAKRTIIDIADAIQFYGGKNHMDKEGNLLDSLCWGVCYDGNLIESGFYREQKATKPSQLHQYSSGAIIEGGSPQRKWKGLYSANVQKARALQKAAWSYESAAEPVNGHQLASAYIEKAGKQCKAGEWKVFFAILAPYWGYWEKGHQNILTKRFEQFAVMTQFRDRIKGDLKPAKIYFRVHVETYASKSLAASIKKNLKKPHRLSEF